MDDGLGVLVEINETAWARFRRDIADVSADEIDWRAAIVSQHDQSNREASAY